MLGCNQKCLTIFSIFQSVKKINDIKNKEKKIVVKDLSCTTESCRILDSYLRNMNGL